MVRYLNTRQFRSKNLYYLDVVLSDPNKLHFKKSNILNFQDFSKNFVIGQDAWSCQAWKARLSWWGSYPISGKKLLLIYFTHLGGRVVPPPPHLTWEEGLRGWGMGLKPTNIFWTARKLCNFSQTKIFNHYTKTFTI